MQKRGVLSALFVAAALTFAPAGAWAKALSDAEFFKLCEQGTAEQVKQALVDGANPNAKDGDASVLEWAALNDNLPAVQALLDAGANPNREPPVVQTALMFAALADNPAMVQALLKAGANPNAKTASGHTALTFWARRHGNLMLDVQQMPPGHAQVVKALLAAGADVNGACSDGAERQCLVPLELEVEVGCDTATVQALLDGGAGKRGRELEQALMLAAWRCAPQGLDVLLKAGASPDTKVADGETALMRAARFGKFDNVAALLKAGANPKLKDKKGHDALWHARHPDMTADVSEADKAETIRLLQGGAPKPAAPDAGAFSAADLKRMSAFVNNFMGVDFPNVDMKDIGDVPLDAQLLAFGIQHNFIHNRASSVKPCPKEGCKYGDSVMEAKFVAEAVKKYFDLEVQHRSLTGEESWHPCHFDGKFYHLVASDFVTDDGPAVHYAKVTRAVREGGAIRMTGDIYEGDNAGKPPRITNSFVVIAKPHKWNGKDTWVILSLKTK